MGEETLSVKTWKELKNDIYKANPRVAAEFDKVVGIDQFPIITVKYPFGSQIIEKGNFRLFHEDELLEWNSPKIPDRIKTMLGYKWDTIPFGMVLKNSFESYIQLPSHSVPLRLLSQGNLFSLLTIFESENKFLIPDLQSATAGSKSLFTLPEIAHKQYTGRLVKKYEIEPLSLMQKNYHEHFKLFKAVSNSKHFRQPWECELMFFSKPFIDRIEQNYRLKSYLLQTAWNYTAFARTEAKYDMLWNVFICENLKLSTRNSTYIVETAKHIMKLILNRAPGFAPAKSNIAGPIVELSNIITNIYKIRHRLPVFMQLQNYDGLNPIYYSLHHHTFFHPLPNKKGSNQTIKELGAIKHIIDLFIEHMNSNKLLASLKDTHLYNMLNKVDIDFFHPQATQDFVTNFSSLEEEDPRFLEHIKGVIPRNGLGFPETANFFKGCIRIKPR